MLSFDLGCTMEKQIDRIVLELCRKLDKLVGDKDDKTEEGKD